MKACRNGQTEIEKDKMGTMVQIGLIYRDALGSGGYPRDVRWLASALSAHGVSVTLFTKDGPMLEGLTDGVRIEPLEHVGRSQIDVYHIFGIFILDQLRIVRKLIGKPLVVSPMGHLMPHHLRRKAFKKRLYLQAVKPLLKKVRWFHVFSGVEHESISQYLGDGVRTFEAGLGVFPVPVAISQDIRNEGRQDSSVNLLFFGRNDVYQKGIDILLEGFARAVRSGVNARLTIAGQPWMDSERYIRSFIESHGLGDAVRLVGPVDEKTKYDLLAAADYLVFLSRWDGPPRPIREAIAVGTPVIVSPETNMGSLVAEYEAGVQVELRPEDVARAILKINMDRELWKRHLGGVLRLRERLDWRCVAEDYIRGYQQVLEAGDA